MTTKSVPTLDLPGQAAAPTGPINLNVNYLVHYALRRDFRRLLLCISDVEPGDTERAKALASHFHAMMAMLYEHHTGEDDLIWPVVREELPELSDLLDEMEAEHAGLAGAVWAALQAFDAFAGDPNDDTARATEDALIDVTSVLNPHLDHEESETSALLQERLDPKVWASIEKNLQKRGNDLKTLRFFVPWLLDGLDEAEIRQVKAVAPRPMVMFWSLRWKNQYGAYSERLWRGCA